MARTDTLGHFLTDVADAIRTKTGDVNVIQASNFDIEIENIPSGGEGYTITTNVTNGTSSGATTTYSNNDAYVVIAPSPGYELKTINITVVGASFDYDSNTQTIKLTSPISDITITAICTEKSPYHAVDCLIATGTQYITTDYIPNTNTRVEMRMNKPSWHENWDSMFGSRQHFSFMQYGFASNNEVQVEMFGASQRTGIIMQFNTTVDIVLDASIPLFQFGNETYTPTLGSASAIDSILIFAKKESAGYRIDHYSNYKLYYFKIYENGTLVRNYMPALDDNDVPCLYETINGNYLYNSGSGTFDYETL